MPTIPANTKNTNPPKANSMGVFSRNFPPQIVATHAKTLMPVGTDTSIVVSMKTIRIQAGVLLAYMWCTQTIALTAAINSDDTATTL